MKRILRVAHVLGLVIALFGLGMVLPILVASSYDNDAAGAVFVEAMTETIACGLLLWLGTRRYRADLQVRDGFLLVVLVWTVLPVFAALPLLRYLPGVSITDAYFECMSGVTTTGATVLTGLDTLPPSINVWRAELVWLGGMGLIVLAVAILPLLGVGGRQMFKAETPGPMKEARLTPRITETARGLWIIYTGISLACLLSYHLAGMGWLDALIHTFSTMGLGGFSSHDQSYGYFDSPAIEAVAIVFMLIAGMNFATHFTVFRNWNAEPYRDDPEAGWFVFITVASILGIGTYLWAEGAYDGLATALRYASFNTVSIATTTGFSTTDYNAWPVFAPLWMLFLSSFVSCSGSTGGGIKMIRAIVLYKQVLHEMVRTVHPNAISPIKLTRHPVANNVVFAVLAFALVYVALIVVMTLALTALGLDAVSAFTAIVACINNTGPGLSQVGPATTYAVLTDLQTWVC
ncbi:MAG: TrkH family potassium uptake protein, partial [Gammaproteobacteria bacterium]